MNTQPCSALAAAAQAFLAAPSEAAEAAIMAAFNAQLQAEGFDALPDGFVEWGCVEHEVIHVCAFEGQQWIEIDPATGAAVAC